MIRGSKGFTLIELMITVVIVAIGLALAVPSWNFFIEKRQLTSAVEQVTSFVNFAQSQAIKSNRIVTVSWIAQGGHSADFCMGISAPPKNAPCDCKKDDVVNEANEGDFCSVDSVPYILNKEDFVDISQEFMHMKPKIGSFGFDPIRGIIVNESDPVEFYDNDYLFKVHSKDNPLDSTRLFALQIRMNPTGSFTICTETGRLSRIGAYPAC